VVLKKAAGIAQTSGVPNRTKGGKVTEPGAIGMTKGKMEMLNPNSVEADAKVIEGTVRSMAIEIIEKSHHGKIA
jgi:large subunit ribosomal protein L11